MSVYWAFRIASVLAKAAPLSVAYAVAAACGVAAFYAWPGGRRRSIANMRHIFRDEARARLAARRSFANYAVYLIDFLRFTSATAAEVHSRVIFDRWPQIEVERRGNGIVYITMHYGNWDLGAAALAERGLPLSVVADTFGDPRLNDLVLGARRALGMTILPAERVGPSVLRALKRNEVVAMLIDVPPQGGGVEAQFFGDTVLVADGPARIALRAGASVVVATVRREHPRSPRVYGQGETIPFTPTGDSEHDVRALTQAIMSALERMVARDPEQWYIFRSWWVADRAATLR